MSERDLRHDDPLDVLLQEHHKSTTLTDGQRDRSGSCRGFDANLAAAYEERTLSPQARRSFEAHLVGCHACRSDFVDFSLTLRVDVTPTLDTEERVPLLARIRTFFGGLGSFSNAQIAMAMSAVVVVVLGTFSWWVVVNRESRGLDVAAVPKQEAPPPASDVPPAEGPETSPGSAAAAPPGPDRPVGTEGARRVAPKREVSAKPIRTPKSAPARTSPEGDAGVTRSVAVGSAAEQSPRIRHVGGKTFLLVGGVWTDREYLARDRALEYATVTVERGSKAFESAVAQVPGLTEFEKLGERVTVLHGDTAYTIVGGSPK